jgi:hypothetical protein
MFLQNIISYKELHGIFIPQKTGFFFRNCCLVIRNPIDNAIFTSMPTFDSRFDGTYDVRLFAYGELSVMTGNSRDM